MSDEPKKLFRSKEKRIIAGVCGGVSDYLGMDVNVVRIITVVLGFWGPALLAYIIAALIIPEH